MKMLWILVTVTNALFKKIGIGMTRAVPSLFDKAGTEFYQCHNAPSPATSLPALDPTDIDTALNALYDSISNKSVDYEEDCTYSLKFGPTTGTEVDTELALLFERFEQLRNNYVRGLWGYCAEKGVEYLIGEITKLKDKVTAATNPVKICDRSKLLSCHQKYKKCKCLVDNKNFRNIAAEYWNDSESSKDEKIGVSKCVLSIGSDCNFLPHDYVQCKPGTTCRYKHNRKLLCNPRPGQYEKPPDSTSPDYRFTGRRFSNIYCQCYSYYPSGGHRPRNAQQQSWILSVLASLVVKYLF